MKALCHAFHPLSPIRVSRLQCYCGFSEDACGQAQGYYLDPSANLTEVTVEGEGAPACININECLSGENLCNAGIDLSNFDLSFDFNYMRPTIDGCSHMVTRRGNFNQVHMLFPNPRHGVCRGKRHVYIIIVHRERNFFCIS
jgi:hypothetical protein